MSIEAMSWAWKQDTGNASAKLVLLAIADHANGDGYCWPSMKRVAVMAGLSTRQVSTHVTALVERGLLVKEDRRRSRGQLRGWTYHVPFEGADTPELTTGSPLPLATGSPLPLPQEVDFRSEPEGNRKEEPSRPSRKRDELFETVVEVTGHRLERLTRMERGRINKATSDLRGAGADPDAVRRASAAWPKLYPNASLTPTALAAHWSRLLDVAAPRREKACELCGGPLEGHTDELCELFQGGR